MKNPVRTLAALTCIAVVTTAATSRHATRLTPARIAELVVPAKAIAPFTYSVEVTGLDLPPFLGDRGKRRSEEIPVTSVRIPPGKSEALLESIREFRYPTEFDPPEVSPDNPNAIVPTTPVSFETTNTGWTVRLNVRPSGKLIAVSGVADYTTCDLLDGGYGPLSGPIYNSKGEVLSPNVLKQPRFQTTSTHFHLFALPGESYEVTLYRGATAEKHRITVNVE